MKRQNQLWWKAFWSWFWAAAVFYYFAVIPIVCGVAFFLSGRVEILSARSVAMPLFAAGALTLAALLMAWRAVENDTRGTTGLRRERMLKISAYMGRQAVLYWNPVGFSFVCARLIVRFAWRKMPDADRHRAT